MRLGIWTMLVGLGCATGGAAPDPAPAAAPAPAPAPEPVPAAEPAGALEAWQEPFAARATKDVRDYFMLLPRETFECEEQDGPASEAERDARIGVKDLENGYLEASASSARMEVALFKDRKRQRDVLGVGIASGEGDMCNHLEFSVWSDERRSWTVVNGEVLPASEIEAKVEALRGPDTAWGLKLPRRGTDTEVVDKDGKTLLTLKWADGRFTLP